MHLYDDFVCNHMAHHICRMLRIRCTWLHCIRRVRGHSNYIVRMLSIHRIHRDIWVKDIVHCYMYMVHWYISCSSHNHRIFHNRRSTHIFFRRIRVHRSICSHRILYSHRNPHKVNRDSFQPDSIYNRCMLYIHRSLNILFHHILHHHSICNDLCIYHIHMCRGSYNRIAHNSCNVYRIYYNPDMFWDFHNLS